MIRDLHTPAVDREALLSSWVERLCTESEALTKSAPGLEVDCLDVDLDRDNEPLVKAEWNLRIVGRSQCLQDDLVEMLLATAAKLMGPGTHSQPAGDLWIDVKVRANRKVGE